MGYSRRGIRQDRVSVTFPWACSPNGSHTETREIYGAMSDEAARESAIAGARYQYGLPDGDVVTAAILR